MRSPARCNLLLRHGADLNLQDSEGGTALVGAALLNHPAVVRRVLRAGADAAARSEDGKTALQLAKDKGHAECVKVLAEAAACPQLPLPHPRRRRPPLPGRLQPLPPPTRP